MIKLNNKKYFGFIFLLLLTSCQTVFQSSQEQRAELYPHAYYLMGDPEKKQIALTFDDGPSIYTRKIVEKLNDNNIKATFFMVGYKIEQNIELVKEIHQYGHVIANHSWDHTNAKEYDSASAYWQAQVEPTNKLIRKITHIETPLFRPPYGKLLNEQIPMLLDKETKIIIWSIDTKDWDDKTNNAQNVAEKATTLAHPGGIILMHDGGGNRQGTLDALDNIIKHYQALNYEFVTVNQMINQ